MWEVREGDCLERMGEMEAASVDLIVTDPPYGLEFMGRDWDHGAPGVSYWETALRVAKPGAHLFTFGGTRTFHRLACAIEDAGWEIRDCLGWMYATGFPKSLDVSKAIDKAAGVKREVVGRVKGRGSNSGEGRYNWNNPNDPADRRWYNATCPATDDGQAWDGWGTALKPAWEPIILARKPLEGTVAANVQKWGVGALNIDGCRVACEGGSPAAHRRSTSTAPVSPGSYEKEACGRMTNRMTPERYRQARSGEARGRWPANVVHDGSQEVLDLFPITLGGHTPARRGVGGLSCNGHRGQDDVSEQWYDSGSAARFFYCAKASQRERGQGNTHLTVKPIALMRYLVRLGCGPTPALVLDPFMGSGSTGIAALLEGQCFLGIEREAEYVEIARRRITNWEAWR